MKHLKNLKTFEGFSKVNENEEVESAPSMKDSIESVKKQLAENKVDINKFVTDVKSQLGIEGEVTAKSVEEALKKPENKEFLDAITKTISLAKEGQEQVKEAVAEIWAAFPINESAMIKEEFLKKAWDKIKSVTSNIWGKIKEKAVSVWSHLKKYKWTYTLSALSLALICTGIGVGAGTTLFSASMGGVASGQAAASFGLLFAGVASGIVASGMGAAKM